MPELPEVKLISEETLAQALDELAPPPSAPADGAEPSAAPPSEAADQSEAPGDSGGVQETEQPNPAEPAAEAEPALHPVLQTLPEDMREGLKGLTPEQQEHVARIRGLYERDFQHDRQEQAELERDAKAFRKMLADDAERREFWRWKRGEGKAETAKPEASLKRPRPTEFDDEEKYQAALDEYEQKRDALLLRQVEEKQTEPQRRQRAIEDALWTHRESLGKSVTDEQFVAAAKAFEAVLVQKPEMVRTLTPESAVLAVSAILAAKQARAPVANPPVKPNPQSRPVKPASVPARGVPPRVTRKEPWEVDGRTTPTAAEAWESAGRDAAALNAMRAGRSEGERR